jgi:5-methylcytosine-specific restriction endonuclease McrBC regulatory subunit McrC
MLEYAYRLKGFHILPGIVDSDSIRELYEKLAWILAGRVLDRTRRGLYRSYVSERDALPYLRGRLDVEEALARSHGLPYPEKLRHGAPGRPLGLHEPGGKRMLPFLVDMARLFELLVAEWLQQYLPRTVRLSPQDIVRIGSTGCVEFRIDLTLHDADSGSCLAVMDTKYKITDMPTPEDVAQIVAYAVARGARAGVLIYPRRLSRPFRAEVGGISVHAVSFPIDDDVEAGGQEFVEAIAAVLPRAHVTA